MKVLLPIFLLITIHLSIYPQNSGSSLINLNPDPTKEPWITGNISEEEWNKSLSGINELILPQRTGLKKTMALSAKVDNSRFKSFRPVFNQKGGSCAQASGVGYIYTYELNFIRGLASDVSENQYPYDYTYNFLNDGDGNAGTTTVNGWNIIKSNGIPNVKAYGGFGLGRYTQWISGYSAYYSGMSNKLSGYFVITIKTASDIDKMKQYLTDHGDGSSQGGCLGFSAYSTGMHLTTLPSGTPDAGKKVIVSFGNDGGHAMTIAGYNDNICYDFNNDKKYTNDVDINGDGVINVKDWEIGGALMVNSWGTGWGDSGKAYVMYKTLADLSANGGIFSNQLIGISIDKNSIQPKLTFKVKLVHNSRNDIRIKAGYSTTLTSTRPSTSKYFSKAFYNAGGQYPMQGINSDPIEIGLDVSDYVNSTNGKSALFFLQIESSGDTGTIASFSLLDYTGVTPVEYQCSETNVAISQGTTTLKILRAYPAAQGSTPVVQNGHQDTYSTTVNYLKSTNAVTLNGRKIVNGIRRTNTVSSSLTSGIYIMNSKSTTKSILKSN